MRGAAIVLVAIALTACSDDDDGTPTATTVVENVVAEEGTDLRAVRVTAGTTTVELDARQRDAAAPLLSARAFASGAPLDEYGLDQPRATVTYERRDGTRVVVHVGDANFDNRGVYVRRDSEDTVFLVLAEQIRPLLALVGVTVPSPTN